VLARRGGAFVLVVFGAAAAFDLARPFLAGAVFSDVESAPGIALDSMSWSSESESTSPDIIDWLWLAFGMER
jgi:hypothetical protein